MENTPFVINNNPAKVGTSAWIQNIFNPAFNQKCVWLVWFDGV